MTKLEKVKSKIENFFYHYKWHTLIALFFTFVITIMAVQMCTRDDYDISVMYAGPEIISDGENAAVEKVLLQLVNNGAAEKDIKDRAVLYDLLVLNDEQLGEIYEQYGATVSSQTVTKNRETFYYQVLSDEFFLLFLSPECYTTYRQQDCIVPLNYMGVNEMAIYADRYDDYAFRISDLDLAKFYTAFNAFPPDTLVCIKRVNTMNKGNGAELQKTHIELYKKMLAFELPADFVPPQENAQ